MDGLFDDLEHEPITRFLRGLKGGSGGGGRGGGYSGGSSSYSSRGSGAAYYGSSSYNNNNGGGGGMSLWVIILICVVVGLILLALCMRKAKNNGGSTTPGSDTDFDSAVSKARGKQTDQAVFNARLNQMAEGLTPNFATYEGEFDIKYKDRGMQMSGFAKIQLKDNSQSGYKIEGDCNDADGNAKITEGFVAYSGDGWWLEETLTGTDKGLKVLTQGSFDFATNTFTGTWRANTGRSGPYTEFKGNKVSKNYSSLGTATTSNPQTLEQMLEVEIPMAVATVETPELVEAPVVHAAPEIEPYVPTVSAVPDQANNEPEVYVPRF